MTGHLIWYWSCKQHILVGLFLEFRIFCWSHAGYADISQVLGAFLGAKTCGTFKSFLSILHYWTFSGLFASTGPCCAPASQIYMWCVVAFNGGLLISISAVRCMTWDRKGLKNNVLQVEGWKELYQGYKMWATWLQFGKRMICPYRLLFDCLLQ